MPDIRELLKQDFLEKRKELRSIEVPELGDGVKVYFYTTAEVGALEAMAPYLAGPSANFVTANLVAFVMFARDEQGQRLYSRAAIREMQAGKMPIDPDLVIRIVDRMGVMKGEELSVEAEMGKSSASDPNAEKSPDE